MERMIEDQHVVVILANRYASLVVQYEEAMDVIERQAQDIAGLKAALAVAQSGDDDDDEPDKAPIDIKPWQIVNSPEELQAL